MKSYTTYTLLAALSILLATTGCKKDEDKGLQLVDTSWALAQVETNNTELASLVKAYQSLSKGERPVFGITFLSDTKLSIDIDYKGMPTLSHITEYAYKRDNGQLAINIEKGSLKIPTNVGYLSSPNKSELHLRGSISVEQQKLIVALLTTTESSDVVKKTIKKKFAAMLQSNIARGEELSYNLSYHRR